VHRPLPARTPNRAIDPLRLPVGPVAENALRLGSSPPENRTRMGLENLQIAPIPPGRDGYVQRYRVEVCLLGPTAPSLTPGPEQAGVEAHQQGGHHREQ
jgi:hypothetical protein